ncbi:MAG: energy-coupling factor transport system ATP-binding protein [Thermoanaerobacter sp.]|nr:energy-coupling factor transport system ATP-binding protein [Thermoanaerobacter sp.]
MSVIETNVNSKEIVIKDLTFRYKDQKERNAIENINLEIEKGEFVVIMGPSGAGKSTLAQCLNGLIPHFTKGHYSGDVIVKGIKVEETRVSKMAKEIGLVFQDFESQLFSTNTRLEIAFGPENFGVEREEIQRRIERILKIVNLEGLEDRQPSTLSGGQKQRLAIGSVLACMPSIICMDEPTTDLDPIGKIGIFNIAKELHKDKDLTLIIIEHETEEALNADRVIIMEKGRIIKDGKPEEILKEVELMEEIGIMPLQIPKYFLQVSSLKREELPLTYEEGIERFKELGLKIDEDKYNEILRKEEEREQSYGDVIIDVKDVEHVYANGTKALDGINLQIKEGEFLALLGHNGSGKTTLAKHLNCLLKPTSGSVIVYGKDTKKSNVFEIGNYVGYAFQNPDHQIFADTVYDEIAFGPRMRGCSEAEVKERVSEALKAVDMEGFEKEDPFSLSKGERQRIAVASILAARPKVIILDEPTTGLDYKEQKRMMELVKKLNESGHTIVMITHTMWIVSEYAHKVAVMKDGKIEMYGKVRDVFREDEKFFQLFLKTPPIVSMSNRLGKTFLSVEEMVSCTRR